MKSRTEFTLGRLFCVSCSKYEEGASEPPIELLQRISRYFQVSIDLLVGIDLQRSRIEELLKLPDYRMVLPVKDGR